MTDVSLDSRRRPPRVHEGPQVFAVVAVALGSAFVALLWVSSYAKVRPTLGGFPFFYWYSLLWLVINIVAQFLSYQLLVARPRRRQRDALSAIGDRGSYQAIIPERRLARPPVRRTSQSTVHVKATRTSEPIRHRKAIAPITVRETVTGRRSPGSGSDRRRLEWTLFGFAVTVPAGWEVFPGQQHGSGEVFRAKRDAEEASLILIGWKLPAQNASLREFAQTNTHTLAAHGYSKMQIEEVTFAGRPWLWLEAHKGAWTSSQYYFGSGTAVYVLGFGTAAIDADRPLTVSIVESFELLA